VTDWGRIAETAQGLVVEALVVVVVEALVVEVLFALQKPAQSVQHVTTHGTMTLTLVPAPVMIAPVNTIVLESVLLNTP